MLDKIFFTFPALSMLLQQYREMKFKKYSEFISYLLVTEQHNDLLMKNHKSRPTGSMSFSEVNKVNFHNLGVEKVVTPVMIVVMIEEEISIMVIVLH